MFPREIRFRQQLGSWVLKVKIIQHIDSGLDFERNGPLVDVLYLADPRLIRGEERERRVVRHSAMGRIAVGQVQLVLVGGVGDVIVDSFLLHESTDKVQVRLPILHAVVPLAIGARELIRKVGKSVIAEDLLNDIRNRLALKNAAICRARQEPQPGNEGRLIAGVLAVLPGP